jgi:1-acyl-sn-glycerol-3-phosphate acyltransferase
MRNLLVGTAAVLALLTFGPAGLLASWLSGSVRPLHKLSRLAIRVILRLGGVRLVVTGSERLAADETYMFVGNHVSNLDPPVSYVAIARDVRTFTKVEVFRLPIFGRVIRRAGFPAIDRSDRRKAIAALSAASAALAEGHDFLAFPEGTRSETGALGEFKKGPFVMAIQASVPVAPFVLCGTRDRLPKGSQRLSAGVVEVEFLEPVPTAHLSFEHRDELREEVRTAIAAALVDG